MVYPFIQYSLKVINVKPGKLFLMLIDQTSDMHNHAPIDFRIDRGVVQRETGLLRPNCSARQNGKPRFLVCYSASV